MASLPSVSLIRKRFSSIAKRSRLSSATRSRLMSKSLHWVGRGTFQRAGFQWEVRRSGDLKIGMWRKKLRKETSASRKGISPKRLVIVPGFGDSPLSWLMVTSVLLPVLRKAGYDELVLLDFPGFNGRLFCEKCFHSMDLMIQVVEDVFDWLQPDTVLGHSLGGWLAARYAADCGRGERPKVQKRHGYTGPGKLLLVAPAGVYESTEVRDFVAQLFRDLVGDVGFAALRPHLFAKEPLWFNLIANEFSSFVRDEDIRHFTESFREDHMLHPLLNRIRAETWFVWGDKDTLVPTGGVKTWLAGLSSVPGGARAVLVRGTGHSPQIESPAVTAAILAQILLGKRPHSRGVRWWKLVEGQGADVQAG
jgi:pimeloyl-ACP methyl ester carboxylesterase